MPVTHCAVGIQPSAVRAAQCSWRRLALIGTRRGAFRARRERGARVRLDKRIIVVVLPLVAVIVVAGAVLASVGFTSRPFDTAGEQAVGMAQNSLGDRYTLDASSITSTWTFTRDADVVLRFADGEVALDGTALDPGCYSGTVVKGAVLTLSDAHGVSFAAPDSDATCQSLP